MARYTPEAREKLKKICEELQKCRGSIEDLPYNLTIYLSSNGRTFNIEPSYFRSKISFMLSKSLALVILKQDTVRIEIWTSLKQVDLNHVEDIERGVKLLKDLHIISEDRIVKDNSHSLAYERKLWLDKIKE